MQSIISIGMIFMMALTLLTGGGDDLPESKENFSEIGNVFMLEKHNSPGDLTRAKEKFSEIETVFNEATELFHANGWNQDEAMIQNHNDIADDLTEIKKELDAPGFLTASDVEEIEHYLDILMEEMERYKEGMGSTSLTKEFTKEKRKANH